MRALAVAQDVALRLEPDASPDAAASNTDTVPPAPMAAVLLANSARWQLRHGATSMAIVLRGLSLLTAQAEGASHIVLATRVRARIAYPGAMMFPFR